MTAHRADAAPAGDAPPAYDAPPAANELHQALADNRVLLWCEEPAVGVERANAPMPLRVVGWAYSGRGIADVTLYVDGHPVRSRYGFPRPDVAGALGVPQAVSSGFATRLEADVCPPGEHELVIVATDCGGDRVGIKTTVFAEQVDEQEAPPDRSDVPPVPTPSLAGDGERYVPEEHADNMIGAEHHARYIWATELAPGREVLDAGCGVGWGTALIAEAGASRAVGLDIDELALTGARARAGGRAEFVRGDLLATPFDDASFDLVVSFEAIEHVDDPFTALDEFRRVLRPHGILAVSSPNRGVYPGGNPFHLRELASDELERGLQSRFTHVAMFRQGTNIASLLTDDRGHAVGDAGVAVDARVHKLFAGRPGDELYTIGLASDAPLPAMTGIAVLTAPLDQRELFEEVAAHKQRAVAAEAELSATRYELGAAQFEHEKAVAMLAESEQARGALSSERDEALGRLAAAQRELGNHRASLSWRLRTPLRIVKRLLRGGA
jgi:SAM-dependent methyltransferase